MNDEIIKTPEEIEAEKKAAEMTPDATEEIATPTEEAPAAEETSTEEAA